MQRVWKLALPPVLLCGAAVGVTSAATRQQVWQADVQIRTLEVTKSRTGISVRVVVYVEHDDDAKDSRLLVLLPVGVGVEQLGVGCVASAGPTMVPSLRATITCELGVISNRGFREVLLSTTLPPEGRPKRFGVFAYSATPDPVPGNNYAERTIP